MAEIDMAGDYEDLEALRETDRLVTGWHTGRFGDVHNNAWSCSCARRGKKPKPVLVLPLDGLEETIAREVGQHAGVGLVITPEGWSWRCRCGLRLEVPDAPSMLQAHPVPEDVQAAHEAHLTDRVARALAGDGAR